MVITKYSKKYNDISLIKKDQFKDNLNHLKSILKVNKIYKKNPKRDTCKNCNQQKLKKFIHSFEIDYYICKMCGHLNGAYKDTKKFTNKIYFKNKGKNYSKNYLKDFNLRVKKIYSPKVDFLNKVIKKKISILDIGSGGGHFLKALENKKILAKGIEPNRDLCNLGNKRLKKNKIIISTMEDAYEIVKNEKNFNVLSMIGVLEHLENPEKILNAFKKSKLKYLYLSVPIFSFSVFLENSFQNIFPRQLSGGHTHLYTESSLNYLKKKFKLRTLGEWWFGTDMPDLYRSIINSANILDKKLYLKEFNNKFYKHVNELQNILDKNKMCSEVHLILSK